MQDMASSTGSTDRNRDLTEGTERLTTRALLAAVDAPDVTARTLEYWRHEGLLPKAERTGQAGKRPEWTYPADSREQLVELLRLRERTKHPDQLRATLWFRGFSIETPLARQSIAAALRRMQKTIMKEIEKRRNPALSPDESRWDALEKLARAMARQRGGRSAPRLARQSREDRDRAMILLFGLTMGFDQAEERVAEDAPKVERLIGVDRGRRAHGELSAWLSGPPSEGFRDFGSIGSIQALIEVVDAASDLDLETARDLARVLLEGISMVSRMTDALTLTDNAAGLAAWEAFARDPVAAIWLTAFVLSVRRSGRYAENLQGIVDALVGSALPAAAQVRELAALSQDELAQRLPHLDDLPFVQRAGFMSLIQKIRDETNEGAPPEPEQADSV
jgi:DNA-binding transcriptional MerR regulator